MIYVGIDGGGTKSKAFVISENERVLAESKGGPTNYLSVPFETAFSNLKNVLTQALEDLEYDQVKVFLSISGIDTKEDEDRWMNQINQDPFFKNIHTVGVAVGNDIEAALRAGTERENAVAVICGTGSQAFGRKGEKTAKAGGMKQILSDEGSGYWMGLKGLKFITKSLDGRSGSTMMRDLFFEQHGVSNLREMHDLVYCGENPWAKPEIAEVVKIVETAADAGDNKALDIVDEGADELLLMVDAVCERLELKDFDLVLAGSVLQKMNILKDKFTQRVKLSHPQVSITEQMIDPALAAALIAKDNSS